MTVGIVASSFWVIDKSHPISDDVFLLPMVGDNVLHGWCGVILLSVIPCFHLIILT